MEEEKKNVEQQAAEQLRQVRQVEEEKKANEQLRELRQEKLVSDFAH